MDLHGFSLSYLIILAGMDYRSKSNGTRFIFNQSSFSPLYLIFIYLVEDEPALLSHFDLPDLYNSSFSPKRPTLEWVTNGTFFYYLLDGI